MKPPQADPVPGASRTGIGLRCWPWVALCVIVACAIALRLRLADVPLERDEGEFAYAGQLLLRGEPPYASARNMKMPGAYAAYAVIMAAFGETHRGIRSGLIVVNAGTIVLVSLLARRLVDDGAAHAAAAAYALLSLSPSVYGYSAKAEHFIAFLAVAGALTLSHATASGRWPLHFLSGLLLGSTLVVKQHGLFFPAFGLVFLLLNDWRNRTVAWSRRLVTYGSFSAGAVLPFGIVCLMIYQAGVFDKFRFWVFQYALEYVSLVSWEDGLRNFVRNVFGLVHASVPVWLLALLGVDAMLSWDAKARSRRWFVLAFVAFSFLCACPGWYFTGHYFIQFLPALALCFGMGVSALSRLPAGAGARRVQARVLALTGLALAYQLYLEQAYLLKRPTPQVVRELSGLPEAAEIGRYLNEHSAEGDRIAVLGSEPQIYFYANRRGATGYMYMFPLFEEQPLSRLMEAEMIREIDAAQPEFVVFVHMRNSWVWDAPPEQSTRPVFRWYLDRFASRYECVGMIVVDPGGSRFYWDKDARTSDELRHGQENWIAVMKRKARE